MTASEVGKEILYLRAILRDVGHAQTAPTNIYEDNLVCIVMSTNPVFTGNLIAIVTSASILQPGALCSWCYALLVLCA